MFSKNVNKVENSWKSDFYDRCCLDNECTDMYSAAARMERKEAWGWFASVSGECFHFVLSVLH